MLGELNKLSQCEASMDLPMFVICMIIDLKIYGLVYPTVDNISKHVVFICQGNLIDPHTEVSYPNGYSQYVQTEELTIRQTTIPVLM